MDVFPMHGQHVAGQLGGFTPPSLDGQVAELKESFKLWQAVSATGADAVITDSSWWMTAIGDPHRRASMSETIMETTMMSAFAVGVLGQLLDAGIIRWGDEDMELPDIPIDASAFIPNSTLTEDEMIEVARLLKDLEDKEDE